MSGSRWAVVNQAQPPAFQRLVESLSEDIGECVIVTGTPFPSKTSLVTVRRATEHRRSSMRTRVTSWLAFLGRAFLELLRVPRGAFVLAVTNPPLLPHLVWALRPLMRFRYGVLVWDIYPDHLVAVGMVKRDALVARAWRALNRRALGGAHFVVTLGDTMAKTLLEQVGSHHLRVEVIPNWADTDEIEPLPKDANAFAIEHGQVDKVTILYAGNIGATHGLERVVELADRLQDDDRFHFLIVGEGMGLAPLRRDAERRRLANMTFLQQQPWERVPEMLATGDIAVIAQQPGTEHLSLPSKSYTSMAAGSALLALTSPSSDLAELVTKEAIGVVHGTQDHGAVVERIRSLVDSGDLQTLRQRARQVAQERYSAPTIHERWKVLLRDAVER